MNHVQSVLADRMREHERFLEELSATRPLSLAVERARKWVSSAICVLEVEKVLEDDPSKDEFYAIGPGGKFFRCEKKEEAMELTEQEVGTLRRLARDNTPMRPVNPVPAGDTASTVEHLDRQIAKAEPLRPANPDEDWPLLAKISHTMRKGERVMEWFARVGLGRSQVFAMTRDEIKRRADLADERQEPKPAQLTAPPEPQRLVRFAFTD